MNRKSRRIISTFAPWGFAALKVGVAAYFLHVYIPRYLRLTYIADGPGRAIEAYALAFGRANLFSSTQFLPLLLWTWAGLIKIVPDIYWTGTALNVAAGAAVAAFLYLLGRQLGGPAAGAVAAVLFTFSPLHHDVTLAMGMADGFFYLGVAAGLWFASREAAGGRGAAAAGFCFAAATLSRYEGIFVLGPYVLYRLALRRPRTAAAWALYAAPLVLASAFLGYKALANPQAGFWPILRALRTDMETSPGLKEIPAYARPFYGFWRLWFDGRVAAVSGVVGAAVVFTKKIRHESRLVIWGGMIALFAGISFTVSVFGTGACPERYFASVLMLLFPFAGLAVVAAWRAARRAATKIVVAMTLAAAAAYTAYFDAAIRDYGYGYTGPCFTCQTFDAEVALFFRALWREKELRPDEKVYMEENVDNWSNLAIMAFSDHPLNFYIAPRTEVEWDVARLPALLSANNIRVAVFVNEGTRQRIKPYYFAYLNRRMTIYENAFSTVVVRDVGWRRSVPSFRSRLLPERARVIAKKWKPKVRPAPPR